MNKTLYHGTQKHRIYSIMMQGFRLDNEMYGRGLGNGVYLRGNYSRIYEHLKRHQVDGVGFREEDEPKLTGGVS